MADDTSARQLIDSLMGGLRSDVQRLHSDFTDLRGDLRVVVTKLDAVAGLEPRVRDLELRQAERGDNKRDIESLSDRVTANEKAIERTKATAGVLGVLGGSVFGAGLSWLVTALRG